MEIKRTGDEVASALEQLTQYAVMIGDTPVRLLSLPPGVFEEIETRHGMDWQTVIVSPVKSLSIAAELVGAAAAKCGVPDPTDNLDIPDLVRFFVEIPADLPDPESPPDDVNENPTDAG